MDRDFILVPELTYDDSIVFFGYGKDNIIFSQGFKSWLIIEKQLDDILGSSAKEIKPSRILGNFEPDPASNQMPFGLHFWNVTGCEGPVLGKLTSVSLSFYNQNKYLN